MSDYVYIFLMSCLGMFAECRPVVYTFYHIIMSLYYLLGTVLFYLSLHTLYLLFINLQIALGNRTLNIMWVVS